MKRSAPLVAILLAALPSAGEVKVSLSPADGNGAGEVTFLRASLRVEDPNAELPGVVAAVSLRRTLGGPTLLYRASIAPGTRQAVDVLLPVVSLQQAFTVRLLAADDPAGPVLKEADVSVTAPSVGAVERARAALVDPAAYEAYLEDLPRWPAWLLRGVLLTLVLTAVALAAALFVRSPAARLVLLLAVTAGGVVATWQVLARCEVVLVRCKVVLVRASEETVVVRCRRTSSWSHEADGALPVYWSPRQMDQDTMVYRPGRRLTLTIRPEEVRVFRRPRQ